MDEKVKTLLWKESNFKGRLLVVGEELFTDAVSVPTAPNPFKFRRSDVSVRPRIADFTRQRTGVRATSSSC